jgi:Putative peptidoglycan binding domain
MGWRNCQASLSLVAEINLRWPGRDKSSDGTIGDAAHATRSSDHNPWVTVAGTGVVRARDVDVDGVDMAALMEHLRKLGAAGDPRLAGGGYLISNGRITAPDFRSWKAYTGVNKHDHHGHVSFSRTPAGFDSQAPWHIVPPGTALPWTPSGLAAAAAAPAPGGMATLTLGMRGDPRVIALQRFLNAYGWRPALPLLPTTGNYLDQTAAVVRAAQAQCGVTGPDADGRTVGPRTAAAFAARGARW